jgi:dolichyl-phosphate-mannose-protein mannosyltransferase
LESPGKDEDAFRGVLSCQYRSLGKIGSEPESVPLVAAEPNLWMGCAYFAILAINRNDPLRWLWFGVVAGLGLEEKYSIAVFGLGMVVGLLLTEQRRVLWPIQGRLLCGPYDSTQFYTTILPIRNGLAVAVKR